MSTGWGRSRPTPGGLTTYRETSEWCRDGSPKDYYGVSPRDDPAGPPGLVPRGPRWRLGHQCRRVPRGVEQLHGILTSTKASALSWFRRRSPLDRRKHRRRVPLFSAGRLCSNCAPTISQAFNGGGGEAGEAGGGEGGRARKARLRRAEEVAVTGRHARIATRLRRHHSGENATLPCPRPPLPIRGTFRSCVAMGISATCRHICGFSYSGRAQSDLRPRTRASQYLFGLRGTFCRQTSHCSIGRSDIGNLK